jgi:transaldolase
VHDEDVYRTADILRPAYDESDVSAGFVSFALPPLAGNDVRAVAAAARRMWNHARRPNVLVQIPATPPAIKAVFRLIPEAVSVHVTHIESGGAYR